MSRSPLLAALAVAMIGLAACGTTDPAGEDISPSATASDAPTTTPSEPTSEPSQKPTTAEPSTPTEGTGTTAPADDPSTTPSDEATEPVTLAFDGQQVPLNEVCNGVDGAILASTVGEVTIMLIREQGIAMRYVAADNTAETDEVAITEAEASTTYAATLGSAEVDPPVEVEMTVAAGAEATLPDCPR